MDKLLTQPYFQNGRFLAVRLSVALWSEFGNGYAGMEFPLPEQAASLSVEEALRLLNEMVSAQADWNAKGGMTEMIIGSEFVAKVAALAWTIAAQAIEAGQVDEFGEELSGAPDKPE